jgi:RNA polymerase sigma-70 factor (ECF subfamily)
LHFFALRKCFGYNHFRQISLFLHFFCNRIGLLGGLFVEGGSMTSAQEWDTDTLIRKARQGDRVAREQLLVRHRGRLRQMIAFRLDPRVAARVDPSDVVQEALTDASRKLSEYLKHRPIPYYPWLRQLALERLVKLHRRHIQAQKRSVTREEDWLPPLPDESAVELADRLGAAGVGAHAGGTPVGRLLREELRRRVRTILEQLGPRDREVLVLRHLEQMSPREMSAVLGISEGAVRVRHLRALQRFRQLLHQAGQSTGEEAS